MRKGKDSQALLLGSTRARGRENKDWEEEEEVNRCLADERTVKIRIISQVLPAVTHDFLFHSTDPSSLRAPVRNQRKIITTWATDR